MVPTHWEFTAAATYVDKILKGTLSTAAFFEKNLVWFDALRTSDLDMIFSVLRNFNRPVEVKNLAPNALIKVIN